MKIVCIENDKIKEILPACKCNNCIATFGNRMYEILKTEAIIVDNAGVENDIINYGLPYSMAED